MKPVTRFLNRFKPENLKNAVSILIVAVLLLAAAVLSGVESAQGGGIDLTDNGVYTLSDETCGMLDALDVNIDIYTLYSPGNENRIITALLKKFAANSTMLAVSNVDPSGSREEISFAENASGLAVGSIIVALEDGSRYTVLSSGSLYVTDGEGTSLRAEGKLITAIDYVATGNTINVRLLYGHQETADSELTEMRSYLDSLNYNVSRYDYLRSSEKLDPKTDILIAVSPKTDLSSEEYAGISEFLEDGGTFIVMMDNAYYDTATGRIKRILRKQDNFSDLLRDYGMVIRRNIIACSDPSKTGFRSTTLPLEADEAYMEKLAESGETAVFSECGAIELEENKNVSSQILLKTDESCYKKGIGVEKLDLRELGASEKGSFVVGAMSEKGEGRLVLFSTSSFVRNAEFGISANSAVLIDAMSFSQAGEPAAQTPPKALNKTFSLKSDFMRVIWVILLTVIPAGALMGVGVYRLAKRKRLKIRLKKR